MYTRYNELGRSTMSYWRESNCEFLNVFKSQGEASTLGQQVPGTGRAGVAEGSFFKFLSQPRNEGIGSHQSEDQNIWAYIQLVGDELF